MEKPKLSSSLEDYLEAIAELVESEGHAHTKDIAARLHFSMSSVTNALQNLAARGLIEYLPNAPVVLTPEGAERAAVIRNRHLAMRVFFTNVLRLDEDEANDTACRMEHIVSEKVMARFVFLAEAITNRSDCASLREHLEQMMPRLCPSDEVALSPLSELPEGEQAIVVKVSDNLRGKKRFAGLGLVPETLVKMEGHAPFGNLLRVKVMFSSLSLRSEDAANILVRLAEA